LQKVRAEAQILAQQVEAKRRELQFLEAKQGEVVVQLKKMEAEAATRRNGALPARGPPELR